MPTIPAVLFRWEGRYWDIFLYIYIYHVILQIELKADGKAAQVFTENFGRDTTLSYRAVTDGGNQALRRFGSIGLES